MKFQRSGNIGSKSTEFVEGSDSIVTLAHSEGQRSSDDDCRSLVVRSALQNPAKSRIAYVISLFHNLMDAMMALKCI